MKRPLHETAIARGRYRPGRPGQSLKNLAGTGHGVHLLILDLDQNLESPESGRFIQVAGRRRDDVYRAPPVSHGPDRPLLDAGSFLQ
jgi:hypothetical protein